MMKANNLKQSKSKKIDPDVKVLEAELEREYKLKRFYDVGPFYEKSILGLIGIELFLSYVLPSVRHTMTISITFWIIQLLLLKYFGLYKGTKDEEYGIKAFLTAFKLSSLVHEIFQVRNDSLASEMGRKAHVSMVVLTLYFLVVLFNRVLVAPRYKRLPIVTCGIIPLIVLKKPRFGIFRPRYEALAFFVAMGLGWLLGSIIDEMQWRQFLAIHKKELEIAKRTKELSRESRKRAMAMEALLSYNDKSSFFEIR